MTTDCTQAAVELGFAVPCLSEVPRVAGEPATCLDHCVGSAGGGETLHPLFFLDVADFDGPDDLGPIRHLTIEARRVADAPPVPCYEGVPLEQSVLPDTTVLACPESSPESQANNRHGEAAHAGHLLAAWDADGVRFVVSVHGRSAANLELLEAVLQAIQVVKP